MSTYIWQRPNEAVKFKGFNKAEMATIMPALNQTDKYLRPERKLNATFVKRSPTIISNQRVAAETRYHMILPQAKAKVIVNPQVFDGRTGWNPSGVVSHEIGHLIGPTRNTTPTQRQQFRRSFSYKQKKVYHDLAPQQWKARRSSPVVKGTRQGVDAAEDFSETWRALTGQAFTNKTSNPYFGVVTTPKRVQYMERYYIK